MASHLTDGKFISKGDSKQERNPPALWRKPSQKCGQREEKCREKSSTEEELGKTKDGYLVEKSPNEIQRIAKVMED